MHEYSGEIDDDVEDDDVTRFRGGSYHLQFHRRLAPSTKRIEPHPYQREAIAAVWRELGPGKRPLLHLATGGGKTLVANDIVQRWLRERGGTVLWITKDWRLLQQAAEDLGRRHGLAHLMGRLGGGDGPLHPLPDVAAAVRYTTIQTLWSRLRTNVMRDVGLVMWDECHWGEHGKAGRAILGVIGRREIPLLGLTATPRSETNSSYRPAFRRTFWQLVQDGYLAKPLTTQPIATGAHWRAARLREGADFTKGSLVDLAENRRRNELIVQSYDPRVHGRTIVFACTKEHANTLAAMFHRRGLAARSIHSDNADAENRDHLDEFRRNRVDIVVNVEMLTHGVDVPSAQTVFLCRPTLSDILYSQMIGRASRLDTESGKKTFNIVEFTDNLERFGDDLCTAKRFFAGAGGSVGGSSSGVRFAPRTDARVAANLHRFDHAGAPTWIPDTADVPEAGRGLWFRKGQTFGFEIELTDPTVSDPSSLQWTARWVNSAEVLLAAIRAAVPGKVAQRSYEQYQGQGGEGPIQKSYDVWNVEYDASAGWEVTSRVLQDEAGYREVVEVARALDGAAQQHPLRVNYRTGLHIHLAWAPADIAQLRTLLRLVRLFEPGLASIVPPSRVVAFDGSRYDTSKPNPYCRPLATVLRAEHLQTDFSIQTLRSRFCERDSRYVTVNPRPLVRDDGGTPTIEIRMHGGTTAATKMLLWLSLWQQILWAASIGVNVPDVPDRDCLQPDADIVELAKKYLPTATHPGQTAFLERLAARRAEIVSGWATRPELSRWTKLAERWGSKP